MTTSTLYPHPKITDLLRGIPYGCPYESDTLKCPLRQLGYAECATAERPRLLKVCPDLSQQARNEAYTVHRVCLERHQSDASPPDCFRLVA
jgi:hypothetical protein